MLRYMWLMIVVLSLALAGLHHQWQPLWLQLQTVATKLLHLLFWMGVFLLLWNSLLGIMQELGWVHWIAKALQPVVRRLFPEVQDSETRDWICFNISANMLGMGNAATPAGLSAMQGLQAINPQKERATDAMCLLLAINTSSVQLIPASTLAILTSSGYPHPLWIVLPTWVVTSLTTLVAILAAGWFARLSRRGSKC